MVKIYRFYNFVILDYFVYALNVIFCYISLKVGKLIFTPQYFH